MRALVCITLLSFVAQVAASDCQEFALETAADYEADVLEINESFNERLAEVETLYMTTRQDPDVSFEMIWNIWSELTNYQLYYDRFTNQIHQVILNLENDEQTRKYCDSERQFKKLLESRLETYETLLEESIAAIEKRVNLESLELHEGLTIVSAYSFGLAEYITIVSDDDADPILIGPLNDSQHFEIMKLSKGKYQWNKVSVPTRGRSYAYFNFYGSGKEFFVKPQALNFAGVFVFENFDNKASGNLYDRSAILVEILESQYPYLLRRYAWHNAIAPNDPFLNYYYETKFPEGAAQ